MSGERSTSDSGFLTRERVADIYEKSGALVLRRCQLILGSAGEAEDVMQDVFVRLMRYGASIRNEEVPISWLYRTAERCCFDILSKRKREPVFDDQKTAELLEAQDGSNKQEALEMILRFISGMPAKYKQIALLHYVDGLSQERISEELGWSRRTIGKKLKKLSKRADRLTHLWEGD